MTGHVVARCPSVKARPRRTPTWWASVLDKHYTVTKSSSNWEQHAEGSMGSAGFRDPTPDILDQPIVEEAPTSLTVGPANSITYPL